MKRYLIGAVACAAALAAATVAAAPARADYGSGAVYQIELSANAPGPTQTQGVGGRGGGGIWIWVALNEDGTGDYAGSDCGHGEGASADRGDVEGWYYGNRDGTPNQAGQWVIVPGIVLNGLGTTTTLVVPRADGHYRAAFGTYFESLPLPPPVLSSGFSQLQVAP
jgi:hypothetical protein